MSSNKPVIALRGVRHSYGGTRVLDCEQLAIPLGKLVGFIGPDGQGKSTLLGLIAGARGLQEGSIQLFGGSIRNHRYRHHIAPRIAFMPQGLGKNLYATLSVRENIDFFGHLFTIDRRQRRQQIDQLLGATGLAPFAARQAGKLSGGMKQKLGLCCALVHNPDLLILDEPTTGVDPLSRRQFWKLIDEIRSRRPEMTIVAATAYMEEAEAFDWLIPMHAGKLLQTGSAAELKQITATDTLEAAFISLLPENFRRSHNRLCIPPLDKQQAPTAIAAHQLTKRFGAFTAVKGVDLNIRKGEIFGFLGSNGCGKTTTMKMLTGLLPPTSGRAMLFGKPVREGARAVNERVGYMSQAFSLYEELTVSQNLLLHARLFHLPDKKIQARVNELLHRLELQSYCNAEAGCLPLGIRQRLSLAVAVIHEPELLILDEPTSGVDPVARDQFWDLLVELSRKKGVTIFLSTHFMNEAERCDRLSLMHAGKILVSDSPAAICAARSTDSLEKAFIDYLEDIQPSEIAQPVSRHPSQPTSTGRPAPFFSIRRLLGYSQREALELLRDPVLLTFALLGSALLMLVLGYGISMDVEDLNFAVLDRDQSPLSREYVQNISGSRYFIQRPPLHDVRELEHRMGNGELSLAIEIPPEFSAKVKRGRTAEVAVWIDGAMPFRAETIGGYIQGLHQEYLTERAQRQPTLSTATISAILLPRYRYNQDFSSIYAIVPAVIPLLLIFIPAILTALSVVREKELGSIVNFYLSPSSRLEFLLGKQLPYIGVSMLSFYLLLVVDIGIFSVPLKGDVLFLSGAALLYVTASTGIGLLMSAFTRTQIAALAGTAILTMLATVNFSGMTEPVSSLEGLGRIIGNHWPATSFIIIARGVFTKGLGFSQLATEFLHLAIFPPVITLLSILLLRRQER